MAIRFGCCLNMVAENEERVGAEHLEEAAKAGFSYVELPLAELTALPERRREEIRAQLRGSGIACETCNNFFPPSIRLTGSEVDDKQVMDYAKHALELAGSFGVEHVVFGSGGAKNVPEGFPMDRGYAQVVKLLRKLAPIAGDNGIVITIEPLRAQECNLINTFAEGCQLAKDVGDERIRVLVDYYHFSVMGESPEAIVKYGREYLRHVHFARVEGRSYPKSLDEDNYAPFLRALREIGYDRRVSCEAYSKNFREEAPAALRFFREHF